VEPWYPHTVYNFVASRFKWEIEPLPGLLLKSLYRRSIQSSKQSTAITPDRMLALALRYTRDLPMKPQDLEGVIQTLLDSSAEGGNIVACALAAKARLKARAVHNTTKIIEWLAIAIGTGSLNARDDLQKINVAATRRAIADFDKRGGYNMAYLNLEGIPPWPSPTDAHEINQLHWLSAFGTIEALRYHLDEYPNIAVNTVSGRHETALYMACARGSWEHVKTLLDTNADPSIKCTASGITCMHWIIAFDMPVCKLAVRGLVEAGAKVDALVSVREDTPFPHYPFVLPAGTPLHWAVATARHEAIKALIDAGASPSIRNGCDPYMYDDRVRWLYAVGGPEAEGCTSPESDCLGLSPLDVAAIHRDPFLFQLLSDRSAIIDANSADEEGFTVLHRLATNQIFRTSRRMAYSPRPFRNIVDLEVLQSIIGAIIKLGGSIEMLTSSAEAAKQKNQRSTDLKKKSYTPLMLAMLEGDTDLVDALLACGADVHTENLSGETALIHTSHRANFEQPDLIKCVQTLVSKGADVNHHSSNGNCALLAASKFKLIEVADFLLCSGACIGETDRKELTATPGRSVFAFFVSIEHGTDEKVFELLKKHILDARNYAKRHGVITGSANDGRTLLHEFASSAMPKCVEFLLQNGAHVNALQRETRFVPKNSDNAKKRVWYETPWDALKVTKEFAQDRMLARNSLSLQETVDVQIRWDTCQELLEKYGGAPCTEPAHYEAYT
jgi:ankyrin repeat protein